MCYSVGGGGQGRQEEAHEANVQRPADLRAGEDVRADQVPGGARARQAGLRPGHDRVPSQGRRRFNHKITSCILYTSTIRGMKEEFNNYRPISFFHNFEN